MEQLLRLARALARFGAWFGGGLMIMAAVLIGVEVVIRKLFSLSLGGADELSGFALAIGTAWALGFALLDRAHIRIDSLYVILPSRLCAVLDILGLLALTAFIAWVAWYGYGVFSQSVALGARSLSPLGTPLVIPQLLWFLGLVLFLLIALLLLIRAVGILATGDAPAVQRLIGSRTVSDELEQELQAERTRRD